MSCECADFPVCVSCHLITQPVCVFCLQVKRNMSCCGVTLLLQCVKMLHVTQVSGVCGPPQMMSTDKDFCFMTSDDLRMELERDSITR